MYQIAAGQKTQIIKPSPRVIIHNGQYLPHNGENIHSLAKKEK